MADLKGTKTEANLAAAFAGESQAHMQSSSTGIWETKKIKPITSSIFSTLLFAMK